MAKLNIVLVEPEIPQNTGNIARTCAATGAALHLVRPMGFEPDDKKLKRAGLDYWHLLDITYYDDLNDFLEKTKGGSYFFFSTKGTHRHSDIEYPDNCYLVFGKETRGLPEHLLMQYPEQTLRIPMMDELLPCFRQRDARTSRAFAYAVPGADPADPYDGRGKEPEPLKLRGNSGIRGAAAVGLPRSFE